jgi:hypothetical protein
MKHYLILLVFILFGCEKIIPVEKCKTCVTTSYRYYHGELIDVTKDSCLVCNPDSIRLLNGLGITKGTYEGEELFHSWTKCK